jgi:hypothetical protein
VRLIDLEVLAGGLLVVRDERGVEVLVELVSSVVCAPASDEALRASAARA